MAESAFESAIWCLVTALIFVVSLLLLWWEYLRTIKIHQVNGLNHFKRSEATSRGDCDSLQKPQSVNYHFTRQCNYQCGFCFHTAKTSFVLPFEEAKRGLKLLKNAGSL